ncbi:rootletin, partial [Aplysia californica]|uniref:Rootletin n=1 Tax=Aplysia californica TaxID=6500 RepID=A0ABM0K585_APLCA
MDADDNPSRTTTSPPVRDCVEDDASKVQIQSDRYSRSESRSLLGDDGSLRGARRSLDEFFDLPTSFHIETRDLMADISSASKSNNDYATLLRLEDSILKDSEDYTIRGTDGNPAKIPARIREIITKNLSTEELTLPGMTTQPSVTTLQEENRLLSQELNRVEDLLSASRADRDELGIKYNALSERLEHSLKNDSGLETSSMATDLASKNLVQQNIELRRKLEEEHSGYKRKLQAYQDGQQRQAQLVQKLQAKLLQYKQKCQDLEDSVHAKDVEITKVISSKVAQYKKRCEGLELQTIRKSTVNTSES